jgi:hypothetical protein
MKIVHDLNWTPLENEKDWYLEPERRAVILSQKIK